MIEIIGILVAAIIAIGVTVYQVKASKQNIVSKSKAKSHENLWNSLIEMRTYFDLGMQTELNNTGTLKLEPIHNFRLIVNQSKPNIASSLYKDLNEFYENIASLSVTNLFEPMKHYLNQKSGLSAEELKKIENEVNQNRLKILGMIERYIEENKKQLK